MLTRQKASCGDIVVTLQVAPAFLRSLERLPANLNMQPTLDPCELCISIKRQLRLILQQLPPLHPRTWTRTCPIRQLLVGSINPETTTLKSLALNQKMNLKICVMRSMST